MKRDSTTMKREILKSLSDREEHSFGDLERKVNTNWISIRNHCCELEIFEAVTIKNNKVEITEKGMIFLKKFNQIE